MQPDSRSSLADILRAAYLIKSALAGYALDDFINDWKTQAAVEPQFLIIGEAMVRIRQHEPDILRQISDAETIIGFRNVLVHAYDAADPERVFTYSGLPLTKLTSDVAALLGDG